MIQPFALLRSLGGAKVKPPEVSTRLADPTGDAITQALMEAGLWRTDTSMGLVRDGRRLTVRIFLPERAQSDRAAGNSEAAAVRAIAVATLPAEAFAVRLSDQLFCERGTKGWVVLVSAQGRG